MLPVVAIVGRPNVGKSTLFNYLTNSRSALVTDMPGVTRDRQYGQAKFADRAFIVIDTGGLAEQSSGISIEMDSQTEQAIVESDYVLFVVDGKSGLTSEDQAVLAKLRQQAKTVTLVVNKMDAGIDQGLLADFYQLGLGEPYPVAANKGNGIKILCEYLVSQFPLLKVGDDDGEVDRGICFAVIGRPNVGKSTLVNRMLGEERVVVFDQPGTTRDSIFIPFERRGNAYTIVDTAGVRRRGKVSFALEKFSVVKTLQAINSADVVIMVLDSTEGVSEQDARLIGLAQQAGRSLMIAVNKCDGLTEDQRRKINVDLDRKLRFIEYAEQYQISAKHGTGVGDLFKGINRAYQAANKQITTPEVMEALIKAVERHPPSMVKGRRIKLRYAHIGGHQPPVIVIHGNQLKALPQAYRGYLVNFFRKRFDLVGTPIQLELKSSDNPFSHRINQLSDRQKKRKQRLMRFVKKKK